LLALELSKGYSAANKHDRLLRVNDVDKQKNNQAFDIYYRLKTQQV